MCTAYAAGRDVSLAIGDVGVFDGVEEELSDVPYVDYVRDLVWWEGRGRAGENGVDGEGSAWDFGGGGGQDE